jgi:hypothetical protein
MSWVGGEYRPIKLIISRRRETCGEIHFQCPFCVFWCADFVRMPEHIRGEHTSLSVRHIRFSSKPVGDLARDHQRFPSMIGTHCKDGDLLSLLNDCQSLYNVKSGVNILVASVEARDKGIHLYFCCFCGEKTPPDKSAQIAHIYSNHVNYSFFETNTRYFFTL